MENAESIVLRAGASEQLMADFGALCETTALEGEPKYALRPTLENLAKFITTQTSGANKDMALFELSHLVYGVAALLGTSGVSDFFLAPEKMSPQRLRHLLQGTAQGVEVEGEQLRISYGETTFDVRFGRMPFLVCLYDFLCSMDGFSCFEQVSVLFEELTQSVLNETAVRACANGLAALMRKYRLAHLSSAQADGKFIQVTKFLQERSSESHIILQDDAVFDFWSLHNRGKDYRGYRTVFDLFNDYATAFEETRNFEAARQATRLGLDHESGEIDVGDFEMEEIEMSEWVSPFALFDQEEFDDIRFFKKKTERGPIESLMAYGPDALRLPLAFIRYEIFGQVQSGITNDLQVGRGQDSVRQRIACDDVQTYEARQEQCRDILQHLENLQASCLHILAQQEEQEAVMPENVVSLTKTAFSKMKRKGFDVQTDKIQAFRRAADALQRMKTHLERYIERQEKGCFAQKFDADRCAFRTQFEHLYKEVLQ